MNHLLLTFSLCVGVISLSSCNQRPATQSPRTVAKLQGLDVSHHNGTVDWQQTVQAGMVFAFAKATEGLDYTDPMFAQNWEGMKAAGLVRGAYHFFIPEDNPRDQARHFISQVKLEPGDLPPVIDVESVGRLSRAVASEHLKIWLDLVGNHYGVKPIIYTSPNFWNAHLEGDFSEYPLWIAQYESAEPILPQGFKHWFLWQYESQAIVTGVPKKVDRDVFHGNLASLKQWTIP